MPEPNLQIAPLVGRGFCADVYAWGEGRVLKLFHGRATREQADREYTATRSVHAAGLPAPAVYELMQTEGRWGIVFERIEGISLLRHIQARPRALFSVVRQFAELHAHIHGHAAPAGLPSLRERIKARIEASDSPMAQKQAALERLSDLGDGTALCHGDFHPANVLITSRGLAVIDWSSASSGDPLGDVACTSRLLRSATLPPWSTGHVHLMLKCLRPVIHRSYMKNYFRLHPGTTQQIEMWQTPVAVAAKKAGIPVTHREN